MDEMTNLQDVQAVQVGDILKGRVTKIEKGYALVDVGYKFDGMLPIGEVSALRIENISDHLQVGEEIEVQVTELNEDESTMKLSKRKVDAEKAWGRLEESYRSNATFEVTIADVVKGGLVADVGVRGFIPASMVERHFVEDFNDYKGKQIRVKIVEFDPAEKKIILSHKAVLEEEAKQEKQTRLDQIVVGQVLTGTVQRLTNFGVFVDIGGVDGLVHISELSHQHVSDPAELVKEGDTVQVKVLKVDPEAQRISLSMKAAEKGPWDTVGEKLKQGDLVDGTVRRLASFGAFVELLPGVEGLVHISQISNRHIANPDEVLEVGQAVKVKILDINESEKRISLSIREAEGTRNRQEIEKYVEKQTTSGTGVTLGDVFGDLFKQNK